MNPEDQNAYEEFCADPYCVECGQSMDLHDGCEWPEDARLWRCDGCVSSLATKLLAGMDKIALGVESPNIFAGGLLASLDSQNVQGDGAPDTNTQPPR